MIAKSKNTNFNRLLSGFLSLLMIISVLPLGVLSVSAEAVVNYAFAVVDAGDKAVAGATVTVLNNSTEIAKAETDATGKVVVAADIGTTATYKVEKDGYTTVMGVAVADAVTTVKISRRPTTVVVGYVADSDGNAIEGANVKLSEKYTAVTGSDGKFIIGGVYTDASYIVNVTCDGYKDVSVSANLIADNMITMYTKADGDFAFAADSVTVNYGDSVVNTLINDAPSANVTFESSDPDVVEVDNKGNVTVKDVTGADEVTISASRQESAGYLSAVAKYTMRVVRGKQAPLKWANSIPEANALNFESDPYVNTVIGGSGDGAVTYTSSDANIASVDVNGVVTIVRPGTVTITATKAGGELYEDASVSYELVIDKADQAEFEFVVPTPDSMIYGEEFTNAAVGGTVIADVVYSSSDAEVVDIIVDENNTCKIVAKKIGVAVITATLPGNDFYKDAVASCIIQVVGAAQSDMYFVKGNQTVTIPCGQTYDNPAVDSKNTPIEYTSSNENVAVVDENGVVTAVGIGEAVIYATAPADENYYTDTTIAYIINVEKGKQTIELEVGKNDIPAIAYGDEFKNPATAKTPVTYTSSDKNIATVDSNGVVTALAAGKVTITVRAESSANYYGAQISYNLTINKANPVIEFKNGNDVTVQFNDNENVYKNEAFCKSMIADGTVPVIEYSVSNTDIVADLDPVTGEFTITGAGTATISVTFKENDRYVEKTVSYTITVFPDDQEISFPSDKYTLISGTAFDEIPVASEVGTLFGTGEITYAVQSDDNGVIKSFDSNTGAIEFTNKVGTVVIVATKAEDRNYNSATATYTLTVEYWQPEREFFAPVGEKNDEASEWYISNVNIKAEDGYSLSFDNHVDNAEWLSELVDVVVDDAAETAVSFYLRNNATGEITAQYTKSFKKDGTAPSAIVSAKDISTWETFLSIFNGDFWNAEVDKFTVSASDAISKTTTEYYIDYEKNTTATLDELKAIDDTLWTAYTDDGIDADESKVFVVYARVTDEAGNRTYISTNGIIHDPSAPVVEFIVEGHMITDAYYDDVTVDFGVTDAEPSSGLASVSYKIVKTKDEVETVLFEGTVLAEENENPSYAELIKEAGLDEAIVIDAITHNNSTITVTVYATDRAGNVTEDSTEFLIRADRPVLTFVQTGEGYAQRTYDFTIHNFFDVDLFDEYVKIEVVAYENESKETVLANDGNNLYTVSDCWGYNYSEDGTYTRTAKLELKGSAYYEVKVEYSYDYAEDQAPFEAKFTVDVTKPAGKLEVAEFNKTWESIIETLTFGLWTNDKVEVTIDANDATTGVASIGYFVTDSTEKYDDARLDALDASEWTAWEDGKTVEIDPETADKRFTVYAKIIDGAGNYRYISTDGIIAEDEESEITITPDRAPDFGEYYTNDVNVTIDVTEKDIYSGIKNVKYWVTCNGEKIEGIGEDIDYTAENPAFTDLKNNFKTSFKLSAKDNCGNVVVYVETTDNAGNTSTAELPVKIDGIAPEMKVEFINENNNENVNPDGNYFKSSKVKITVIEKNSGFAEDVLTVIKNALKVEVDGEQVDINNTEERIYQILGRGTDDNGDFYVDIEFIKDGKYTVSAESITDVAGNVSAAYDPYFFVRDTLAPTGTITVNYNTDNIPQTESWSDLSDKPQYSFDHETADVDVDTDDATSGVQHVKWFTTKTVTAMTKAELDKAEWTDEAITFVDPSQIITIYIKIVDNAGNYTYVGTNGLIIENNDPEIDIKLPEANANNYYNDRVLVDVTTTDKGVYSGIANLYYEIRCDGNVTESKSVTPLGNVTDGKFYDTFTLGINIYPEQNNSDNVELYVKVTDNAGNEKEATQRLKIDATAPTVKVEYTNNNTNENAVDGNYTSSEVKVTVTERTNAFDAQAVINALIIKAADANGDVADAYTIGEWTTVEGATPDEATHSVVIKFVKDARYSFGIGSFTDKADNASAVYETDRFVVDTTVPTGTITVGGVSTWDLIIEKLTFGLFGNAPVDVSASTDDVTSGVQFIQWFKSSDRNTVMTKEALDQVEWSDDAITEITPDELTTLYIKVVDNAGNYAYYRTSGIIIEDNEVGFTLTPVEPNANGLYNDDVKVDIAITDPEIYSGINKVEYWVICDEVETQRETIYTFDITNPEFDKLADKIEKSVVVEAAKNNSNNVTLFVAVTDNSGNVTEKSVDLKIDITAPVITVDYDVNDGVENGGVTYFDSARKATIVITERNFDPSDVIATITNTDGVIPAISAFTTTEGTDVNGDDTIHTATIEFTADGDYTFEIAYKDEADNAATDIKYNDQAPQQFTIDMTKPVVVCTFNNNSVKNEKYYNDVRVLNIIVTEHNFDPSKFTPSTTAQGMDEWKHDGDNHSTNIYFNDDGVYGFFYSFADKAENSIGAVVDGDFIIDKTAPTLSITDDVKETDLSTPGAYNDKVSFTVTYTDLYIDTNAYQIKLTDSMGNDLTDAISVEGLLNSIIDNHTDLDTVTNTYFDDASLKKLPDGIYTLKITGYDLAGNSDTKTKMFSVNRDSSNYLIDSYLEGLIKNTFNKSVTDKVVIREINCTELSNISVKITRDNETITLEKDKDYTIEVVRTEGDWYEYSYIINSDLFADDGNYKILIESEDAAGNQISNISATGEYRKSIEFAVDDTAPTIIVSGLDDSPYDAEQITAFITYEDNIAADRVEVTVTGGRDESVTYVIGEGDLKDLNSLTGQIEHIIKAADDNQTLTFVVYDEAGNVSESVTKTVTVSTNFWVLFINNTPVLVSSIIALVLILGAAVMIPVMRKRRAK